MPEVMITNVIPTPSTAQTATFCEISEKLPVDRKRSPAMSGKEQADDDQDPENPERLKPDNAFQQRLGAVELVCPVRDGGRLVG